MPLTDFQREVFRVIRENRTPESFIMGATVLNAGDSTPRYSKDIDVSHDIAASVSICAQQDESALQANGYTVTFAVRQPTFQRAIVARDNASVVLEWVFDSAFRFFPVEPDPELGYRLHLLDAATNKVLALAGRSEPRDLVDIVELHENTLSLGALAWAAAGKDEGMNPTMILDLAHRFARYRQEEIDSLDLARPIRLPELMERWREAKDRASDLVRSLPAQEVGCFYLDRDGAPVDPDPEDERFAGWTRHRGSVGGAWPRLAKD